MQICFGGNIAPAQADLPFDRHNSPFVCQLRRAADAASARAPMRALAAEAGAHSRKVRALPHYDTDLSSRHQIILDIRQQCFLLSQLAIRPRPDHVSAILYLDLCSSVPCILRQLRTRSDGWRRRQYFQQRIAVFPSMDATIANHLRLRSAAGPKREAVWLSNSVPVKRSIP